MSFMPVCCEVLCSLVVSSRQVFQYFANGSLDAASVALLRDIRVRSRRSDMPFAAIYVPQWGILLY